MQTNRDTAPIPDASNNPANKRPSNQRSDTCTSVRFTSDTPEVFAFPKVAFTDDMRVKLGSRDLRQLRLSPLVTVKAPVIPEETLKQRIAEAAKTGNISIDLDARGYRFDLLATRGKGLPAPNPAWPDSPKPTTLYITATTEDPERIMHVMVRRSLLDMLGTYHNPPLMMSEDETEDPFFALPGRHIWRPGEVYATAYGAPRMYRVTRPRALQRSDIVPFTAISPKAALAMQRISSKEAYKIISGVFAVEGFMKNDRYDNMRKESVFKTLLTLSGGLGGGEALNANYEVHGERLITGGIAENFPVKNLQPLRCPSYQLSLHLGLVLNSLSPLDSVHKASISMLTTVDYEMRRARYKKMRTKAEKLCKMYMETMTFQHWLMTTYGAHEGDVMYKADGRDDVEDDSLPYGEELRERFVRDVALMQRVLGLFVNDDRAFEDACKEFTEDKYHLRIGQYSGDTVFPKNVGKVSPSEYRQLFKEIWMIILVQHHYVESFTKRMTGKEIVAIAMMTGIPITCMTQYFYNFLDRTGIWLASPEAIAEVVETLTDLCEREQRMFDQGLMYGDAGYHPYALETDLITPHNPTFPVLEELVEQAKEREVISNVGEYRRRINAAARLRTTHPFELVRRTNA